MLQMKWHNLNIGFRIAINSGPALLLWAIGFYQLVHMGSHHANLLPYLILILSAWTAGFGGYLVKRGHNNKLDLEAAVANVGDKVSQIKKDARAMASPTPPTPPSP